MYIERIIKILNKQYAGKKTIKVIVLPPDVKKEIAAEVGCTVETVYNALNLTNPTVGEQPDRIRRMAREQGGYNGTKIRWIEA